MKPAGLATVAGRRRLFFINVWNVFVMSDVKEVVEILRSTLQLGRRADAFTPDTPLLGHVPEVDSMAVVAILTAIEDQYGITIDDDEMSAEVFATVGSLSRFVDAKLGR